MLLPKNLTKLAARVTLCIEQTNGEDLGRAIESVYLALAKENERDERCYYNGKDNVKDKVENLISTSDQLMVNTHPFNDKQGGHTNE